MPEPTTDPRILQLAEARYRSGYGPVAADAWDTLDPALRQHLINEAAAWLRAAIEAGIVPPQASTAEEQPAVEACGKCRRPFNPDDPRWDGSARYQRTPFCRRCIDLCQEADAFHRCVICE